jgi:hypothetical protein
MTTLHRRITRVFLALLIGSTIGAAALRGQAAETRT